MTPADLDALEALYARLTGRSTMNAAAWDFHDAVRDAFPALLAAARRYQWLRENGDAEIYVVRNWTKGDDMPPLKLAQLEELDQAIDAALSSARQGASDAR